MRVNRPGADQYGRKNTADQFQYFLIFRLTQPSPNRLPVHHISKSWLPVKNPSKRATESSSESILE